MEHRINLCLVLCKSFERAADGTFMKAFIGEKNGSLVKQQPELVYMVLGNTFNTKIL